MKRSFKVSVVAAALALCGVAAHAAEKVTIQLKWVPQAQFAGYYVAQAKGFYKEAGLDVTIKAGGPDISPVQVIAGKSADVIVNWMPDALAARDARAAVRLMTRHLGSVERNLRLDPRMPDLQAVLRPETTR